MNLKQRSKTPFQINKKLPVSFRKHSDFKMHLIIAVYGNISQMIPGRTDTS